MLELSAGLSCAAHEEAAKLSGLHLTLDGMKDLLHVRLCAVVRLALVARCRRAACLRMLNLDAFDVGDWINLVQDGGEELSLFFVDDDDQGRGELLQLA